MPISDGLGGFVVEGSAALTILVYLAYLWFSGGWNQKADAAGIGWSVAMPREPMRKSSQIQNQGV